MTAAATPLAAVAAVIRDLAEAVAAVAGISISLAGK
jgi:hypothetical protein